MQSDAISKSYKPTIDFAPNVLKIGNFTNSTLLVKLLKELSYFFKMNGHIGSNYAKMNPMSYLKEHSDLLSNERESSIYASMVKLQIPLLTNDKVAMMWSPTPSEFDVVNFELGGIYIIDNVRTHSVVNVSTENRYNLTCRFTLDSLRDKSLLD